MVRQSAKRQPDGTIAITLFDGTALLLRPVDAGDLVSAADDSDENMMLSRLVIKWGDRSSVMGSELSSRGFLDVLDLTFLKTVLRKLFTPDLDKLKKGTQTVDLGKDGLRIALPSGLSVHLRRPDGYDLERVELDQITPGELAGLGVFKSALKLAALTSLQWGAVKGSEDSPAITYDHLIERGALLADDAFALLQVVSDHFFRVDAEISL